MPFFYWWFQIFFLSSVFSSLVMMCLSLSFFEFILLIFMELLEMIILCVLPNLGIFSHVFSIILHLSFVIPVRLIEDILILLSSFFHIFLSILQTGWNLLMYLPLTLSFLITPFSYLSHSDIGFCSCCFLNGLFDSCHCFYLFAENVYLLIHVSLLLSHWNLDSKIIVW